LKKKKRTKKIKEVHLLHLHCQNS